MKGEYIPSASARQQFERESEGRVAQLTAEVARLEALVDIDLATKVNVLRDALDHVVSATKYDEPHWRNAPFARWCKPQRQGQCRDGPSTRRQAPPYGA